MKDQNLELLQQMKAQLSVQKPETIVVKGIVSAHKKGFGFLDMEDGSSSFISSYLMRRLCHGDIIEAVMELGKTPNDKTSIVKILSINEKYFETMIGQIELINDRYFVQPSFHRCYHGYLVHKNDLNGAEHGDYVYFKRNETEKDNGIKASVVIVIGKPNAPGFEHMYALVENGLVDFNLSVNEDIKESSKMPSGYKDFRHIPFVTIDSESTQDMDDAVHAVAHADGSFDLNVAIADVAAFVKEGSDIDNRAIELGQTIYMPGLTVPMLNERLSSTLCSLKPGEDRQALVGRLKISATGAVTYKFEMGIIRSRAKLSYNEVNEFIEGWSSEFKNRYPEVWSSVKSMYEVYRLFAEMNPEEELFDRLDHYIQIDYSTKKAVNIKPVKSLESHKVIERCMLLMNQSATRYLMENNMPALYRVHGGLDEAQEESADAFVGEVMKADSKVLNDYDSYLELVNIVRQSEMPRHYMNVVMRFIRRSHYSHVPGHHFGLGCEAYLTVTSPIRKYTDLVAHRAIRHLILGTKAPCVDEALSIKVNEAVDRVNATSRIAERLFKLQFAEDFIMTSSEELILNAKIIGVDKFGLQIVTEEHGLGAYIHRSQLTDGNAEFKFNPTTRVAKVGDILYKCGDTFQVKVSGIDRLGTSIEMKKVAA